MERYLFPARVGISAFDVFFIKVFFPICTLTWRVNNYIYRQRKGINSRNESTKLRTFVLMILPSLFLFSYDNDFNRCQVVFLNKINSVFTAVSYFPVGNGNFEK